MDKHNVVYPFNGIFGNKEEQSTNACYSMDERSEHANLKIITKDHEFYLSIYMKCPELANL